MGNTHNTDESSSPSHQNKSPKKHNRKASQGTTYNNKDRQKHQPLHNTTPTRLCSTELIPTIVPSLNVGDIEQQGAAKCFVSSSPPSSPAGSRNRNRSHERLEGGGGGGGGLSASYQHRRIKSSSPALSVSHYGFVELSRSSTANRLHNSFGLPDEALQQIFINLSKSLYDLHVLLLVCKTWRRLAIKVGKSLNFSDWLITHQVQSRVRQEVSTLWETVTTLRTQHILKSKALLHTKPHGPTETSVEVFVTGWRKVGKTALCYTMKEGAYPSNYLPMCFDKCNHNLHLEYGDEVKLIFWDAEVTDNILYRKASLNHDSRSDCYLLCYSIANRLSFDKVDELLQELRAISSSPVILVGTMRDLRPSSGSKQPSVSLAHPHLAEGDFVSVKEGINKAKKWCCAGFYEISAMYDPKSVVEVFKGAAHLSLLKGTNFPTL